MNYRLVLKTYTALRQLTDEESALLNTLRAMNDTERELLVEALNPTRGTGKGLKRTTKKHGKSQRASGIATQLNKNLSQQRQTMQGSCTYRYPDDSPVNSKQVCDEDVDNGVHDPTMGYVGYHEFVPPAQSAAASGD